MTSPPATPPPPPRPTPPTPPTSGAEPVPAALAGERLDRVVSMVTGRSRSDVSAQIADGRVTVNGDVVTARTHRVAEGDLVSVEADGVEDDAGPQADASVELRVVHEDADVVVIDKPAGLVVHPGAGHAEGTLVHGLLARYPELASLPWPDPERPGIVHRLDRDTSGLLMVARTPDAMDSLVAQLAARSVERRYLALVWGTFDAPAGEIDAPIARSRRDPTRMTVADGGKEARTGYVVESTFHEPVEVSLLSCRLFTGRTHQIRVHLRSIGHPVVGDRRYGGYRQSFELDRFFLHAADLGLDHPRTGERLRFHAPLPGDLDAALARLGP